MNIYAKTDEFLLKETGLALRKARKKLKISQKQLSSMAGVPRISISRIENGENFNMLTFIKLLRALEQLESFKFIQEEKLDSKEEKIKRLFDLNKPSN